MDGNNLIRRIRIKLNDLPNLAEQGQFWDDREILLALNNAQDLFIDFCIRTNKYHYLYGLLVSFNNFVINNSRFWSSLPADYFSFASASVIQPWNQTAQDIGGMDFDTIRRHAQTAKVYIGGEAFYYYYVNQNACFIFANNITFRNYSYTNLGSVIPLTLPPNQRIDGVLYYYHYPAIIIGNRFDPSFPDWIYENVFVDYAILLLGMKETQSQREFKMKKRLVRELSMQPEKFANFVEERDRMYDNKRQVRSDKQNG